MVKREKNNNIWQHKKTYSTGFGLDKFYCTFPGFGGDVEFSGYTVLTRNATVQTVIGKLVNSSTTTTGDRVTSLAQ